MKTFLGKIENGQIKWNSEYGIYDLCNNYDGRKVRLELLEDNRTMSQNSYYWFYLSLIENETGNLADDIHEYAKRKFLPPRYITINGKEIKIPSSTTNLKKQEFSDYLDKISAWSEVPLPDPRDAGYITNY